MRISSLLAVVMLGLSGLAAQERAILPAQTISEDTDGRTLALSAPEESQIEVRELDGRWTLRLRVESPGAAGQQLFIENLRLPEGATLNVRELDANGEAGPVVAAYAGVGPLNGDPFWTAAVPGAAALLEIQYSREIAGGLPFQLTRALALTEEGLARTAPAIAAPVSQYEGARGFARFRGNVVPFEVREGLAIYDNDIILGEPHEIDPVSPKDVDNQRQSQGITSTSYRWPGGVIPYDIDATMPNQYRITDAVNHWNTYLSGYIRLVPRTSEAYYVRFVRPASSGTCNSYIGYIRMAAQPINIGDSCSTGNAIHEIGHAIGLYHEHTREDRNSFVKINYANITSTATSNFDQAITTSDDLGAYDYGSIMHYGAYAFSANGLPTIETIPGGISIGQRSALSAGDIAGVKTMYPSSTNTVAPSTVGVTIASNPSGQALVVDGVTISATTTFQWAPGSSHTVSAPNSSTSTLKYAFKSWSDGGAQTHTVTAPTSAWNLTASYTKQYNVKTSSSNTSIGTAALSPTSSDSFYNEGSSLSATATATGSACFTGWSGITAPAASPITINVNQAYSITANFQSGAISASPSSFAFSVAASNGSISVSASTGCAWTARSNASWIKITSGASGTGNGVVNFSVSKRTGKSGRTGTLTVGGNTITVVQ